MAESMALDVAGETLLLLADRAVYRPARERLYLADLHLGKADIFRQAGIAMPSGGTQHDLGRIAALVDATQARSVWVLGDFLHGAIDSPQWRRGWEAFRDAWPALEFGVLAGNHDRALARAGLDLQLLGDAVEDGALSLRHAPDPHAPGHVLCGHLHPTLKVEGLPGRWPAFWLQARTLVLPAFSAFTGGRTPRVATGESLVACIHDSLLRVT
ncbi:phosphoesterase [Lysobacter helvus]|uniref:Phosphoesterase n=2 Tax=Lysobacteraceae TaxID=32033 RepID=A0ABN6FSR8_9GAMM|nr:MULTISPECIES: ligase-associated DNA damage response endonuclease PdeM [Lysobacter]BCT92514.1 phosphoesterase [Lysobacter caseinilyticus]BCT95667.1 phosphoesterase [Lysobacter helvus]